MVLDAREGQCECRVFMATDEIVVHAQETGGTFPHAPCARGGEPGGLILAGQATMERGNQVVTLDQWNGRKEMFPRIGKQARGAFLVEPFQLPATQHEDAAQHQFSDALRMRFRIGQRQRRTPTAAKHLPLFDTQSFPELLDIGDQVPGAVVHQIGMRRGAA